MMTRRTIASLWVAVATVPAFVGALFLFGCCVLPFHQVLHKMMPLCEMAAHVARAEHADDQHDHEATPPAPDRGKDETLKRFATAVPKAFRLTASSAAARWFVSSIASSHRSLISLGAMRCDQDVGLYVLIETYRI